MVCTLSPPGVSITSANSWRARFQHKYKYDVYAHLARFAEWSDADDEEED
jgi:hypothetical protein